jgi:transposase
MGSCDDAKEAALRKNGTFNTRAGAVSDDLFCDGEFFDPRDLVQVKYEMLRRVREEGAAVSRAAGAFGFSRVAFYQIQRAYAREGLAGLLPRRRGPKRAHKITEEVVDFLRARLASDASLRVDGLVDLVRQRFGLRVHPRSIERALERRKKGAL